MLGTKVMMNLFRFFFCVLRILLYMLITNIHVNDSDIEKDASISD